MAPIENYIEPDEVGEERARDLYQYYQPPTLEKPEAVFLPYPDAVLQAHAQLAACRLNIQRAIVCLMDKNTQYFVAEATKTVDLEDGNLFDNAGDGLYYGAISIPKKGGLQEWTLAQTATYRVGNIVPAHFEVLDLSRHACFKNNQHVATDPYFRYYCGVPITTDNNVNIGCLFVLDTGLKPTMNFAQLKILKICARNIMLHLQTVKDAHEKKRTIRMNMAMAEFINPERFKGRKLFNRESTDTASLVNGDDKSRNQNSEPDADNENGARLVEHIQADATLLDQLNASPDMATEADHQRAFDRAAHLLRQSLDLQLGGGVVLLEATINGEGAGEAPWQKNNATYTEQSSNIMPFLKRSESDDSEKNVSHVTTKTTFKNSSQYVITERVILAGASISDGEGSTTSYGRIDSSYKVSMTPSELRKLCKKYPKGKLFTLLQHLDENSAATMLSSGIRYMIPLKVRCLHITNSPLDDSISSVSDTCMPSILTKNQRQFTSAKQIIFIPMFHANFSRWTACFAYTTSPYRVFSYDTDYVGSSDKNHICAASFRFMSTPNT
jgi:hypothetical protein